MFVIDFYVSLSAAFTGAPTAIDANLPMFINTRDLWRANCFGKRRKSLRKICSRWHHCPTSSLCCVSLLCIFILVVGHKHANNITINKIRRKPWLIENYSRDNVAQSSLLSLNRWLWRGVNVAPFIFLRTHSNCPSKPNVRNCIMTADMSSHYARRGLSHTKESEMKIIRLQMRHFVHKSAPTKAPIVSAKQQKHPKDIQFDHNFVFMPRLLLLLIFYFSFERFLPVIINVSVKINLKKIWWRTWLAGSFILFDSHLERWTLEKELKVFRL